MMMMTSEGQLTLEAWRRSVRLWCKLRGILKVAEYLGRKKQGPAGAHLQRHSKTLQTLPPRYSLYSFLGG